MSQCEYKRAPKYRQKGRLKTSAPMRNVFRRPVAYLNRDRTLFLLTPKADISFSAALVAAAPSVFGTGFRTQGRILFDLPQYIIAAAYRHSCPCRLRRYWKFCGCRIGCWKLPLRLSNRRKNELPPQPTQAVRVKTKSEFSSL